MKIIEGGVCAAKGFVASGVASGIKKKGLDLALIFSEAPCKAAGAFTKNIVKAAPIVISQKRINKKIHTILANSGNANCCNGSSGLKAAYREGQELARILRLKEDSVLIASTGIIGKPFPVEKLIMALPELVLSLDKNGNKRAKLAIMTTDTFSKEISAKISLDGKDVRIGGMAKGAGMIHPDLATMLCFITTDANIEKAALKRALKDVVESSFNSISVDGDTSTNDSVILLANGLAGNKLIKIETVAYKKFFDSLKFVAEKLAKLIVKDGEGATKFITIKILGAQSKSVARNLGRFLAASSLLKCALYGEDPNWGRIVSRIGSGGIKFRPEELDIYIGHKKVLSKGVACAVKRPVLEDIFKKDSIDITLNIGKGPGEATCYTTDLSVEYVKINSAYE